MQSIGQPQDRHWWAEGDTPVRNDSRVTYLVDGRAAFFFICRQIIKARQYVYLANWGMTAGIELVRGPDHHAGPDESTEQEHFIAELRAEGFSEQDITFWHSSTLSLQAVLSYVVSKGAEVKVLLWDGPPFSHHSPEETRQQFTAEGITCLLDDSSRGILHHPVESLHQKISIIDGTCAFVGGVDPLIEHQGEFDRWDTPSHPFSTPLRRTSQGITPHPWHDAHAMIEGPAAGDVEHNFCQRWNEVVNRHKLDESLLVSAHPLSPPLESTSIVQIARTIPQHTYSFGPTHGIQGISQFYANALSNITHFIYLENQYLWLRAFTGIDVPFIGVDSPDMERILHELAQALNRGATIGIVLPDHPNVGRAFTDAALARLYNDAPQAVEERRLLAFCLATSTNEGNREHYRPIYVHAKVAIVDDLWTTVGSANLNNRGMRDETRVPIQCVSRSYQVPFST
ncbi:MAG TPA: phospholipase D family protein [Ktedonobacteraceae bacterium]